MINDLKVTCHGQVIAAIVAVDQATAQKAARMVRIDYEELQPVILTIEVCRFNYELYYKLILL